MPVPSTEEIKKPPKKRLLSDARQLGFQLEQDRKFEHLMNVLESQQQQSQSEIDPEVDAFVNGIVFLLQKSTRQQRECLFADICALIYNTLFPKRSTAPRPRERPTGAEPALGAFRPPRPAIALSVPSVHGDNSAFSSWGMPPNNPQTYLMDGSSEMSHTIPFQDL